MKKPPSKIVFQDTRPGNTGKVEALKIKIAAGEYHMNPHNIAEKLMATGVFFNLYKTPALPRAWLLKPRSF
jgi:hypothetical protein